MIVTTKQLFAHAYGKYAVGAYNINNLEQVMGLFQGCIDSRAPFIIQLSKGARAYTDKRMLEAMIRAAEDIFPDAVFAVHLDHGDEKTCMECIASGFYSSVMIDASHDPFDENVAITRRVVDAAHAKGVSVEAELGMLGGVEEDIAVDEKNALLTDPMPKPMILSSSPAAILWPAPLEPRTARTNSPARKGCTLSAFAPFSRKFPAFRLVMHGSSSRFRRTKWSASTGRAANSKKAQKALTPNNTSRRRNLGVCKVNIDTDGRLVWTRVHREFFRDKAEDFDLRSAGKIFMPEYAKFIASRNEYLGSAGQLDSVRESVK